MAHIEPYLLMMVMVMTASTGHCLPSCCHQSCPGFYCEGGVLVKMIVASNDDSLPVFLNIASPLPAPVFHAQFNDNDTNTNTMTLMMMGWGLRHHLMSVSLRAG